MFLAVLVSMLIMDVLAHHVVARFITNDFARQCSIMISDVTAVILPLHHHPRP